MSKVLMVIYGLLAYTAGVIGFGLIVLAIAGWVPWGFLGTAQVDVSAAVFINALLIMAWGIIHSVMARPVFKNKLTQLIPEAAERPTYVLIAGLTSVGLIGHWHEVPGTLWSISSGALVWPLWGVWAFGWSFLLAATFAINHYDLFGLRQVYYYAKGLPRPPLPFIKRAMYHYVRHPIQTGVLIGVWCVPTMSMTQLMLSIGFTGYIFIGLWLEEADLIAEHGDEYRAYMAETGKVFPKWR